MELLIGLCIGLALGALLMWMFTKKQHSDLNEKLQQQLQQVFSSVSQDALKQNTEQFFALAENKFNDQLKIGGKELEGKKQLIDQNLDKMHTQLKDVEKLMKTLEKDREQKFGQVNERLTESAKVIKKLQDTADGLSNALSGKQSRGQWGERMAEDVLRLSGLIEGVNYVKQKQLEQSTGKPDFTFTLPNNLKVNMDVKFPFSNYEKYINAQSDSDKEKFQKEFLKDVKARVKEVQNRAYINPEENTVDYMLMFIPNEQIYTFIQEVDQELIEEAMKQKIILCSPLTLYAILAVIRQSIDNFAMESKSRDMLALFGAFKDQWIKFKESLDKVRTRFDGVHKEYEQLLGTRTNQLEKPLRKIEAIRVQRGVSTEVLDDGKPGSAMPTSKQDAIVEHV